MHAVELSPATEADLDLVATWAEHPSIRDRLGIGFSVRYSPEPRSREYGGTARNLCAHKLVARDRGSLDLPIGFISVAVYGRPTIDPDSSWQWEIVAPLHAGVLYFVDPARHGRGIGTAMLPALLCYPDLAGVEQFRCSIEEDNLASQKVAEAAGFERQPLDTGRADKRMFSYLYQRPV